jgi:hypothetical protein
VYPERREEFTAALDELLEFAGPWYEEGCNFAFHGWARNPNQWIVFDTYPRAGPRYTYPAETSECCSCETPGTVIDRPPVRRLSAHSNRCYRRDRTRD